MLSNKSHQQITNMRLTKNTNKSIRHWVDNVLDHFDLVLGDVSYREHYETLQRAKLMGSNESQLVESMRSICGCVSKDYAAHVQRISYNPSLDNFLNNF
jgi:hypothetical protein